jgi:hypothetical protein
MGIILEVLIYNIFEIYRCEICIRKVTIVQVKSVMRIWTRGLASERIYAGGRTNELMQVLSKYDPRSSFI